MSESIAASARTLELRLIANQTSHKLDLGGRSPAEFRQHLQDLDQKGKAGGFVPVESFPPPPAVDLQVEILHIGEGEAEIWLGGDDSCLTLELVGPGPITVSNTGPFTADVKYSSPIKLAAGDRHVLPLKHLFHGFRGYQSQSYWTEPGEYLLTAHYQLGSPAQSPVEVYQKPPSGPELSSAPVRIEVTG